MWKQLLLAAFILTLLRSKNSNPSNPGGYDDLVRMIDDLKSKDRVIEDQLESVIESTSNVDSSIEAMGHSVSALDDLVNLLRTDVDKNSEELKTAAKAAELLHETFAASLVDLQQQLAEMQAKPGYDDTAIKAAVSEIEIKAQQLQELLEEVNEWIGSHEQDQNAIDTDQSTKIDRLESLAESLEVTMDELQNLFGSIKGWESHEFIFSSESSILNLGISPYVLKIYPNSSTASATSTMTIEPISADSQNRRVIVIFDQVYGTGTREPKTFNRVIGTGFRIDGDIAPTNSATVELTVVDAENMSIWRCIFTFHPGMMATGQPMTYSVLSIK